MTWCKSAANYDIETLFSTVGRNSWKLKPVRGIELGYPIITIWINLITLKRHKFPIFPSNQSPTSTKKYK